jgi:hypothetical protein
VTARRAERNPIPERAATLLLDPVALRLAAHPSKTRPVQPRSRPEAGSAGREASRESAMQVGRRRGLAGEPWVPPR